MSRTQYFTLGHSGLRVSRLALGAMRSEERRVGKECW